MRSQSQHYHSRPNNLLQRQPLFEDGDDLQGNLRQPTKKVVDKHRLMNIPRPYSFPTKSSSTTTVASEAPPALAELFDTNEEEVFEYEDENPPKATFPETPIPPPESQTNLIAKPEDDFADEIKSNSNVLDSAKPGNNVSEEFASKKEETPGDDEPVILTSNFYLPENVKAEPSEYDETEAAKPLQEKPQNVGEEYDYEYEEYEEEEAVPNSGTISTSTTENVKSEVIDENGPSSTVVAEEVEPKRVVNTSNIEPIDDEMEVLGEAVVSVVTTKSVINGSTSTVEPDDLDFYDEEEPIPTEHQVVPDKTTPTDTALPPTSSTIMSSKETTTNVDDDYEPEEASDSLEQGAGNSSTENYLVVASVQTSRSVSGARYLPFPQVKQHEKKQALDDDSDEDNLDERNLGTKSLDPFDNDSIDTTTLPTVRVSPKTEDDDTEVVEIETSTAPIPSESSSSGQPSTTEPTTVILSSSTESTIDKLDRVQSELLDRSGLLSGKFPILNEMPDPTSTSTTEDVLVEGTPASVIIRKFMPRTTPAPRSQKKEKPHSPLIFEDLQTDDLTESLLPPGFKPRNNSYRNKKVTSPSTSTTTSSSTESIESTTSEIHHRSANISRSFKNHPLAQDTHPLAKPENVAELPKTRGYTTKLPFVTVMDSIDLSKFLPPGYKPPKTQDTQPLAKPESVAEPPKPRGYTTKQPFVTVSDSIDWSKFLPSGYKAPKTTKKTQTAVAPPADFAPISDSSNTNKKPAAFIPVAEDISRFLPPGYKPPADELPVEIPIADDILRQLLPKGYTSAPKTSTSKPKLEPPKIHKFSESDSASKPTDASEINIVDSILNKIQFKDVSALLPQGFKPETVTEETLPETTTKGGFKVVFPKGIKRPGSGRVTTAAPVHTEGRKDVPVVTIRKGLRWVFWLFN